MTIVDVHTHIFPDELALKAIPKMAKEAGIQAALDGRSCSLLQSMNESRIDVCWLQPVATKPSQIESINAHMESVRSEHFLPFGAIHPDYEDLGGLVHDLSQRGFPGVKIHPEYHRARPNDERYTPLYEALEQEHMIILYHAGVDIGIPTLNSTPRDFIQLRERFPRLPLILAHMGGFQQWKEVTDILAGGDFYLDTSYSLGHFPDNEFVDLVYKHGVNHIVFGTDSPWADQKTDLEHLKRLPFSPEEQELILGGNALRLIQNRK